MARLHETFHRLRAERRKALIPYVTGGDPDLATTSHILDALVAAGADVIELGVPFSDPMADGEVIQHAMERAIDRGANLSEALKVAEAFRRRHPEVPLVLFGYLNPIYALGLEAAVEAAHRAGIDALLIVDLPMESADEILPFMKARNMDLIGLFTPTTDARRVAAIAERASGFAYCVSAAGVTGGSVQGNEELKERVRIIQEETGLPTAVGFGIRTGADAARIADFSDGVVVGSALVNAIAHRAPVEAPALAGEFVSELRAAIDGAEVIPFTPPA